MKRTSVILLIGLVFVGLAFIGGLKVGFDQGMVHSFYADAPARGAIAIHRLNALRNKKTDFLHASLEFEVDQSILWHNDFLNSYWLWLLNSGVKTAISSNEKYMKRIAEYRLQYPSPTEPTMFDTVPPDNEQNREWYRYLAQGVRENRKIIDAIVDRYGKKE
jgi:hypothetical protein